MINDSSVFRSGVRHLIIIYKNFEQQPKLFSSSVHQDDRIARKTNIYDVGQRLANMLWLQSPETRRQSRGSRQGTDKVGLHGVNYW